LLVLTPLRTLIEGRSESIPPLHLTNAPDSDSALVLGHCYGACRARPVGWCAHPAHPSGAASQGRHRSKGKDSKQDGPQAGEGASFCDMHCIVACGLAAGEQPKKCPSAVQRSCASHVSSPIQRISCETAGVFGCVHSYGGSLHTVDDRHVLGCTQACRRLSDRDCIPQQDRSTTAQTTPTTTPTAHLEAWHKHREAMLKESEKDAIRSGSTELSDDCSSSCLLGCGYASLYAAQCTDMCARAAVRYGKSPVAAEKLVVGCSIGCMDAITAYS